MKTRNTTVKNIEVCKEVGFFDIDCGRFGKMIFDFDIEFNVDSDCDFESVTVKIGSYDWELLDGGSLKFGQNLRLNNRNTKLICEYIESIISVNPEKYGFDPENYIEEYEPYFPDFEEHYYGNR